MIDLTPEIQNTILNFENNIIVDKKWLKQQKPFDLILKVIFGSLPIGFIVSVYLFFLTY